MSIIFYKKKNFKAKNFNLLKKKIFKEKKIIIFKKFFSSDIDKILKIAKSYAKKKPRFSKYYPGCKDVYIFNRNIKKSKVRGYYKKILLFPWNKKNNKFFRFFAKAFKIKNYIDKNNNYSKNIFFNNIKTLVIQIMNYPSKNGYLSKHIDSKTNTKCIMQICVNDKINNNSGLTVYIKNKKHFVDNSLKKGDLIIFSSSLKHSVEKNIIENRWSLILSELNYN